MKYEIKVFSIQEFGQRVDANGQPHQEDSMFPEFGKQTDSDRLFILCDGMGGHDAGEVASATVCEAMSASIQSARPDAEGEFATEDVQKAVADALDALDAKDNGAAKKMGTTMTLLKLHSCGATIAHIGDSRVWHIRPGKTDEESTILFHTEDHSLINALIKNGDMTLEEARKSNQKNVITRAMQPNMERRPKADIYTTADIRPGDYFYLCSDGMLEEDDMDDGSALTRILASDRSDEEKVEILRGATEFNRDNHTAFVIHIIDVIDPLKTTPADEETQTSETKVMGHEAIVEDEKEESRESLNRKERTENRPAIKPKGIKPKTDYFDIKKILTVVFCVALIAALTITLVKQCGNDVEKKEVNPKAKKEKKIKPEEKKRVVQPSQEENQKPPRSEDAKQNPPKVDEENPKVGDVANPKEDTNIVNSDATVADQVSKKFDKVQK